MRSWASAVAAIQRSFVGSLPVSARQLAVPRGDGTIDFEDRRLREHACQASEAARSTIRLLGQQNARVELTDADRADRPGAFHFSLHL